MKKAILYIENSVFGFYYDDKPENKSKMQSTRTLFQQIQERMFIAFTSPITVRELFATPKPHCNKLLALVNDFNIEVPDIDEDEVNNLAEKYLGDNIVPEKFRDDARHVACATLLRVDVLVSFNLEHIVNEWCVRKFNAVNLKEGYSILVIRTPEEVVHYGY